MEWKKSGIYIFYTQGVQHEVKMTKNREEGPNNHNKIVIRIKVLSGKKYMQLTLDKK